MINQTLIATKNQTWSNMASLSLVGHKPVQKSRTEVEPPVCCSKVVFLLQFLINIVADN